MLILIVFSLAVLVSVAPYLATYPYWNVFAFLLIWLGVSVRRDRKLHPPLMVFALFLDFALAGTLIFRRNILVSLDSNIQIPFVHSIFLLALGTGFLYLPTVVLGWQLKNKLKEDPKGNHPVIRRLHLGCATLSLVGRTLLIGLVFFPWSTLPAI